MPLIILQKNAHSQRKAITIQAGQKASKVNPPTTISNYKRFKPTINSKEGRYYKTLHIIAGKDKIKIRFKVSE